MIVTETDGSQQRLDQWPGGRGAGASITATDDCPREESDRSVPLHFVVPDSIA